MDCRPQSSDGLDSQRRVRGRHVKQFKRDSINSCGWNCLGLVRNEWPIPDGTRNFGSGLTNLRLLIARWDSHALAYATAKDKMIAFLKDRRVCCLFSFLL